MSADPLNVLTFVRSGGQTGADRAALDAARRLSIPIRGFVPRGGWAEDATTPPGVLAKYPELVETDSDDPAVRTRLNVRDSHATLILSTVSLRNSAGTVLTREYARSIHRPCLLASLTADPSTITSWILGTGRELTLNVAGPRESEAPGLYEGCLDLLTEVFGRLHHGSGGSSA
ncbi:MAG: putative molybdenum carrier protein [Bowdeniella nasicola]|nr:putative molybdenum carrier protein [Bowdeniella nasicola]